MSESKEELSELKKISKILLLANAETIERELSKIATSDVRKKMWVLIDGSRSQTDIARAVGVTQAAVSYFISAAVEAQLVENPPGKPPRRVLDYVPPSWLELVVLEQGGKSNA